jgi:hypothetical protein
MTTLCDPDHWTFCARDLGGKLGRSYAVDLPNGARIFSSSNDDNPEAHMRQVSAVPQLVTACRLMVQAYAIGVDGEHVDWDDIDTAHDAAQLALGVAGVEP